MLQPPRTLSLDTESQPEPAEKTPKKTPLKTPPGPLSSNKRGLEVAAAEAVQQSQREAKVPKGMFYFGSLLRPLKTQMLSFVLPMPLVGREFTALMGLLQEYMHFSKQDILCNIHNALRRQMQPLKRRFVDHAFTNNSDILTNACKILQIYTRFAFLKIPKTTFYIPNICYN
jgi:hypothetical protein